MMKRIDKIIEYGLYTLVFLLPWQTKLILRQTQLGRGDWQYGTIVLFGTDILLIVLLILFYIIKYGKKRFVGKGEVILEPAVKHPVRPGQKLLETHPASPGSAPLQGRGISALSRGDAIWIILSGLDLFIFISIFFASDLNLALYHYVLILLGMGLFWLIVKAEYDQIKLVVAFLSGLVIESFLAIGQFLLQGAPASKWLGLAAHWPSDLGASVIETLGADGIPERWLRAYGSLDHPNILGGLAAIGLIVLIWLISRQRRADEKKADWRFIVYLLAFIIIFLALLFSFSRTAVLALAAGIIIFLIDAIIRKDRRSLRGLGLAVLLAAIMFGAAFCSYQNLFITRTQATARLEVKSISERKMYLADSFSLIKRDWLFGSGVGNYTKALAEKDPQRFWYDLQPVNNVFLLVWVETGIFGLLFFLALLGYLFGRSIREKNILNLSILSILVIIMMFDHYLWSLHFGILLFWLAMGFIYRNLNKN